MEYKGLNELREMFLSFFVSKGHFRMDSFPLIPQDDKSLLLINAGMAPLKKYFLGQAKVPGNRATTCQKCIRTPDIERVGKTSRHGTYFEMLGNFSFGDYFKKEATAWAWEFCTKVVGLDPDRLYVSVFLDDDEAYDIWTKGIGVREDHMTRLGREDNFWEIGSGPCGPCSEIYYDRGEKYGCGQPGCKVGCDCDRYVEFWNLVFTQFISDGAGNYTAMEHKNIDTGMGLERLACIVQGVDNLFEVDTVRNIMKRIEGVTGVSYHTREDSDVSLRVITDHIRSTVFLVGDGVAPSNEGRGYVLRRLIRRAARHGRLLGVKQPFLFEVCDTVIDENASAYPSLEEHRAYIKKVIRAEEDRFAKTVDAGFELLGNELEDMQKTGRTEVSGEFAFKLNDTYGFPIDLTKEIVSERGLTVDEAGFASLMNEQKTRAREDAKKKDFSWESDMFKDFSADATEFEGYEKLSGKYKIVFLAANGRRADSAGEGDEVSLVLDKTVFYAESGGQVGDRGVITAGGARIAVNDTKKSKEGYFIHHGQVVAGEFSVGDEVTAQVDERIRNATRRNHTSAHLLQQALREVLGEHVHQAGSYVDEHRVRFDFSHFEAVKPEELAEVEHKVNEAILAAINVVTETKPIEEAKKSGALALFGEKYGDTVCVVTVPGVSVEFCGGTHIDNTARLGLFKILSESSVAAGIRRIEGTTGEGVLALFDKKQKLINTAANALKAPNPDDVAERAAAVADELRETKRELSDLSAKLAGGVASGILSSGESINGVNVYTKRLDGEKPDGLRAIADDIRRQDPLAVVALACVSDGRATFTVACGDGAIAAGASAGELVKKLAGFAGGSGGGKKELAMAGAKEIDKVDFALSQFNSIIVL